MHYLRQLATARTTSQNTLRVSAQVILVNAVARITRVDVFNLSSVNSKCHLALAMTADGMSPTS